MKSPVLASLLLVSAAFPAAVASAARLPATRQVADLKSFFHGEPAPPPKAPPPKATALVSLAAGVTPDPQVEDFFRAFATAVKARDGAPMLPLLSDQYTIADLPEDHKASDFFVMGVERIPGPEAITLQSVELKGTVRTVKAEIRYAAKTVVKTFRFDAAGKLLASDLFVLKRVEHGT
jgi:hypothetical protein